MRLIHTQSNLSAGGRLFTKYVVLFVAVVCIALVTNGLFEIWFFYQEHKSSLIRIQREQAEAASGKIGQFVKEIEAQLGWTTQLPWIGATLAQRRIDAMRLLRQVPAITELAQVDPSGIERLRVSRLETDVIDSHIDVLKDPKFVEAMAHKIYYGPVYFRSESEPYMTLALAGDRRDAGVSVAEVNLKFIWDVISQIKVGEHGHAYVVDAMGRLIAHPDLALVLRVTNVSELAQVQAARAAIAGFSQEPLQVAQNLEGREVLTAYAQIAPLSWLVFVELPRAEAYAPLYTTIKRTGLLLLAALGLAAVAGMFLARQMVVPIKALQAGAVRIGHGELGQRISVKTGDELEVLADQFNEMAGRLQDSYADLERKVATRTRELARSVSELRALGDVSQVVNSTLDLQNVLTTIVSKAVELSSTEAGSIFVFDNTAQEFVLRATHGMDQAMIEEFRGHKFTLANPYIATAIERHEPIQIPDIHQEPLTPLRNLIERAGYRAILVAPLMRPGETVGVLVVRRRQAGQFSNGTVDLIKTFATQSVLAIQNARLFSELHESLQQQTATADVLKVISGSPGELQPVFDTMLARATQLCEASYSAMWLRQGDGFRNAAFHGALPEAYTDLLRSGVIFKPGLDLPLARVAQSRKPLQIADLREDRSYLGGHPLSVAAVEIAGIRTLLAVPMFKETEHVGAIVIYRREIRAFTDKQVELVNSFAAQAVIAIDNTRLLKELNREREALARQHQADARYISWLRQLAGFLRHEVRQPVAQINSSVELIHLTSHDDQLRPYIASASQGVRHVWNLIERASRATDAEAFVRQGQAQPIDLPPLLRELIGSYQQTHSGIDFRLQPPDKEPLYVSADPTLLKEAVSNLLANAASFADEESIIQVVLERDGVHAVIKVRNKGPIIQYDTEMLFGPFASTRSGPSSEHQGLGLYLVRLVAEHHGGKAIISNLDDGSGVEASIFLPL